MCLTQIMQMNRPIQMKKLRSSFGGYGIVYIYTGLQVPFCKNIGINIGKL